MALKQQDWIPDVGKLIFRTQLGSWGVRMELQFRHSEEEDRFLTIASMNNLTVDLGFYSSTECMVTAMDHTGSGDFVTRHYADDNELEGFFAMRRHEIPSLDGWVKNLEHAQGLNAEEKTRLERIVRAAQVSTI